MGNVSTNFIEIISGTDRHLSSKYIEAAKRIDKDNKSYAAYVKKFMASIENIASKNKVKDSRISGSKGDIENFKGYKDIKKVMEFIKEFIGNVELADNLEGIYKYLLANKDIYREGYSKGIRLIILEYENAIYLLTSGYATLMASLEISEKKGKIYVTKTSNTDIRNILSKTIGEFKIQLYKKEHKEYLDALIDAKKNAKVNTEIKESTAFMEAALADTIELVDSIFASIGKIAGAGKRIVLAVKNSLFGIIPLIRTVLYLRYKRKADTVLALEQQASFIEFNIENLRNNKTIDPDKKEEIIKKQQAVVDKYMKKAAKLRAELSDGEREAEIAIKQENPELQKSDPDEDFVLEGGVTVVRTDVITEAVTKFTRRQKAHANSASKMKRKSGNVNDIRAKALMDENKNKMKNNFGPLQNPDGKTDEDLNNESAWKKIYDEFCKAVGKKSIRLRPGQRYITDSDMNKRTVTKIGGNPYWPKDMEWPKYKGKDMICYCQLNLDKLPKLPGFPSKGIMQFFVAGDEWEDTGVGEMTKVIIHEDIVNTDNMLVEIPRSTMQNKTYDGPIEGVYFPKAELETIPLSVADYQFHKKLIPIINKVLGTKLDPNKNHAWDYCKNDKMLWKTFNHVDGCRVGGHPYFTQHDIREYNPQYTELLLQIDSEDGIMWGDCGVANFFISENNLKKQNFKNTVFYTWDCC